LLSTARRSLTLRPPAACTDKRLWRLPGANQAAPQAQKDIFLRVRIKPAESAYGSPSGGFPAPGAAPMFGPMPPAGGYTPPPGFGPPTSGSPAGYGPPPSGSPAGYGPPPSRLAAASHPPPPPTPPTSP